jgi:hypothetical protein
MAAPLIPPGPPKTAGAAETVPKCPKSSARSVRSEVGHSYKGSDYSRQVIRLSNLRVVRYSRNKSGFAVAVAETRWFAGDTVE